MDLRPAELAGQWYPSTPEACDGALAEVARPSITLPGSPRAAIVPHAGWVYSGAVAFEALKALAASPQPPDLIVLFGGHLVARDAIRVFIEGGFETPYGPIEVPEDLAGAAAMALSADPETPDEYYEDNAIEVILPMVKKLWPNVPLLTVGVPPTDDAKQIAHEIVSLAGAQGFKNPFFIGSTDLTHYGPNYRYSPHGRGFDALQWAKSENDRALLDKIEALDANGVLWMGPRQRNACCPGAVAATIFAARKFGCKTGVVTAHTTSFDVRPSGPTPESFVGYAGVVLG